MAYVADLHTHSRFAGACSTSLNIANMAKWAQKKGIDLLGTGDCLHPLWFNEIKNILTDNGDGTYQYDKTRFIISTEVSCIYSEGGQTHRIHLLIYLPSLESAANLATALSKKGGKLASDGRPILGLSSKSLCQIVFGAEPKALVIPAHIWTPWFSLYGSNSGYDTLADCFGEFSDQIYAVETGLSSEPAMNWRVGDLDQRSIISFSDLHSLPRLGREVTIFGGSSNFSSLTKALKTQNIIGTIEFFPEEGKYHYSGHRNCNVVYNPQELAEKGEICPVCNKRLTIGVTQRVEQLAIRSVEDLKINTVEGVIKSTAFPARPGFRMLVQLEEILAESFGVTVKSQKVQQEYERLVTTVDTELMILTKTPIDLLAMTTGEKIADGVKRVREGRLVIEPGFDNTYGRVHIWNGEKEDTSVVSQPALF